MPESESLTRMEPRPMSPPTESQSYPQQPHSYSAPNANAHARADVDMNDSVGQLGLNPSQIPDHPSSMWDVPRPSNNYGQNPSNYAQMTSTLPAPTDLSQLKTQCQFNLREYQALMRKRQSQGTASTTTMDLESRLRSQQHMTLSGLRALQDEVKVLVREAENHRWRKWLLGGAMASFIPLVRKIFRRGEDKDSVESSNDTEYAFKRSQGILSYIKDSLLGSGKFASIAFFVFAVLYVFQNEVSLRVARTMQKRVRKLSARIERGDPSIEDKDIKMLEGWRWRVLLW